jgi:hypothetical protein
VDVGVFVGVGVGVGAHGVTFSVPL